MLLDVNVNIKKKLEVEIYLFFFKQKTAYEMCGRDWSSDVCSSDLPPSSSTLPPSLLLSPPSLPPFVRLF